MSGSLFLASLLDYLQDVKAAFLLIIPVICLVICAFTQNGQAQAPLAPCPPPPQLLWTLQGSIQRSKPGFTEGLIYQNGALFESTGNIHGRSVLNRIDPTTGRVSTLIDTPGNVFGEGLTYINGLLFQLTYREKLLFIYDPMGTHLIATKANPLSEGWGLTTDGQSLIGSTGTNQLFFLNPFTLDLQRTLSVRNGNTPIGQLNALQYVRNSIYANVFLSKTILKIDSQSGCVTGTLDLSSLYTTMPPADLVKIQSNRESILNGIAYDPTEDVFFVTGKEWPKIFKIKIAGE